MEEDKQRKEEAGIQNKINEIGRDKRKNKSSFKMIASRIAKFIATVVIPLLIKLAPIIIGAILIGALIHILDLDGDNSTAGVASVKVINDKENVDIEEAGDEGYYFKINKDIEKKYLEEINRAYHLRILGRYRSRYKRR